MSTFLCGTDRNEWCTSGIPALESAEEQCYSLEKDWVLVEIRKPRGYIESHYLACQGLSTLIIGSDLAPPIDPSSPEPIIQLCCPSFTYVLPPGCPHTAICRTNTIEECKQELERRWLTGGWTGINQEREQELAGHKGQLVSVKQGLFRRSRSSLFSSAYQNMVQNVK
ncbi:hypothetical protein B0H17DRAFT_1149554 [Mycena rosella]|uniref:Uncharacterized protein n=1 Tax=Mycena rosella TaxID=1033263 RepID=A0AAD7C2V7_MYCRO|nr:hypothetical protein B0H17DRAFT_1149554 [Mycena rosella]